MTEAAKGPGPLTIAAFQAANVARCISPAGFKHPLDGWSTLEWCGAACGEAGEAANFAKKIIRIRDDVPGNKAGEVLEMLKMKCAFELADNIIYSILTLAHLGFDAEEMLRSKFNATSMDIGYEERV